jgi:hypothetical protein
MRELRVPILVNRYEQAVDVDLAAFCARRKLRLLCKPRLADVLPVDNGRLDWGDKGYSLMAHFDFVVADADGLAVLAIEFDGPRHSSDPVQIARDEKKDRICRNYALPLVRAGAAALRQADRRTFLQWLLEVWGAHHDLSDAWDEVHEADENGEDPGDLPDMKLERFNYRRYGGIRDREEPGRMIAAPLDAFRQARKRIGMAWLGPFSSTPDGWFRETDRCTVGHVAIEVGDSAWLLGTGRVNLRGLYPWVAGLCPEIVAQDIALLDLSRQLDEWERGNQPAMTREGVEAIVHDCERMLLAVIELPSRAQRMQFVLQTIKQWGVDTDDPRVWLRVHSSFYMNDGDGPRRGWHDDDEDEDGW